MADEDRADRRTIGVRYRAHRFARIRLRYPYGRRRSVLAALTTRNHYPTQKSHPDYDAELAMQLLDETGELPTSKHDLVVVLTEYRHALHALASQALSQT